MKLQIVSDLHLEFAANRAWLKQNPLIPVGDILLIAGDCCTLRHPEIAQEFFYKIAQEFPIIISTLGNHEFYGSDIELANPLFACHESFNHLALNNHSYIYEDLRIICSILWSHVPSYNIELIEKSINDYHHIYKMQKDGKLYPIRVEDTNALHEISYRYIQQTVAEPFEGKTVVLTHHMPSYKCISERYKNSPLSSAFAANMDEIIQANPQISYWFYGHAHDFQRIQVHNSILIRNPLGYVDSGEHVDFRRDYFVEI